MPSQLNHLPTLKIPVFFSYRLVVHHEANRIYTSFGPILGIFLRQAAVACRVTQVVPHTVLTLHLCTVRLHSRTLKLAKLAKRAIAHVLSTTHGCRQLSTTTRWKTQQTGPKCLRHTGEHDTPRGRHDLAENGYRPSKLQCIPNRSASVLPRMIDDINICREGSV